MSMTTLLIIPTVVGLGLLALGIIVGAGWVSAVRDARAARAERTARHAVEVARILLVELMPHAPEVAAERVRHALAARPDLDRVVADIDTPGGDR